MSRTFHLRDTIRTTEDNADSRQPDPHAFHESDELDASERGRAHGKNAFRKRITYLGSGTFSGHGARSGASRKAPSRGFLRIRRRHDPDA